MPAKKAIINGENRKNTNTLKQYKKWSTKHKENVMGKNEVMIKKCITNLVGKKVQNKIVSLYVFCHLYLTRTLYYIQR